jgi:hypothetical protein
MSKTERDLDREIDALDDDLDDALDNDLEEAVDDGDDDSYELPEIILATEDDDEDDDDEDGEPDAVGAEASVIDPSIAREADDPEVSGDVLEELRRAEIDGPTVALAPQDDTSSSIRRPRRSPDYDPAPYPIPMTVPRVLGRKPRVRRVTRVVRHVDPWSVFKIAIVANIVLYLIVLTAGVLLWNVAYATGTVDNVERFFESFGWSSFEFNGGEIYHNAWIGGHFFQQSAGFMTSARGTAATNDAALLMSAPDIALDPYWKDLSDIEKREVWQALNKNPANLDEILRRLK